MRLCHCHPIGEDRLCRVGPGEQDCTVHRATKPLRYSGHYSAFIPLCTHAIVLRERGGDALIKIHYARSPEPELGDGKQWDKIASRNNGNLEIVGELNVNGCQTSKERLFWCGKMAVRWSI